MSGSPAWAAGKNAYVDTADIFGIFHGEAWFYHNGDTVKAHDLAKDGKRVVLRTWAYDPPAPGHMPPDSQIEKRRLDVTGGTGSYGTANYNFPEGWRVRIQICLQDGYDGTPTQCEISYGVA
ncbi:MULTISPECIES: hypothetical protein [Streptomyces]|uniref:Secreted protein n=1 Tax=Streptomyces albidoflavus TaxID=1886 RepID=A0ABY3GUK1_9ACTN|nr:MULTISPECIES: hypothetical protein [Streptomyces]TWV21421.1 hypothetical protein FRZ02_22785 [Streptomyces albidoflavus]